MTCIHDSHSSAIQNRSGPRRQTRNRLVLPETDHKQLQRHLERCERMRQPSWTLLAHVLHQKILSTDPVSGLHARDLVTGGCHVDYSVNFGFCQTGLLVHRARCKLGSGVIPVPSLLGATLIGMRVGQRAPLLCEDGSILSLLVLHVTPPN